MFSFAENLKELMDNDNYDVKKLSKDLNIHDSSKIYSWLSGKRQPNVDTLISIADIFSCSVNFILGLSDDANIKQYKMISSFNERLNDIMKKSNTTQYRMEKDLNLNASHFHYWFKLNAKPKIKTLIKLTNYFGVTADYLLGRD